MAPLIFALALLAQDAPATEAPAPEASPDGPVATAVPRKQTVAPLPIQSGAVTPPSDDYGYVGWCYGAMSGYVELYDRAMPEVTRIERAWPTPSTEENIREVYPAQRDEAKRNLVLFANAMEAAEKASPTPIQDQGAAAIRRGRGVWTGAGNVPKAQLAQFWMSWSPPAKCEETAKALQARSNLFGQALSFNAPDAAPMAPPPPEAESEPAPLVTTSRITPETAGDLGSTASVTQIVDTSAADSSPEAAPETETDAETLTITSTEGPIEPGDVPMLAVDRLPSGDAESDADIATTGETSLDGAGEPGADLAATPEPDGDATGDAVAPTPDPEASDEPAEPAPALDAAALSSGTPAGEEPATDETAGSSTAIDDLLPADDAAALPEAEAEPAVTASAEREVSAEPATPAAPEQPAKPKRKKGLKDTLMGLKGPQ